MPMSRATARSDRLAPSAARCCRATDLISSIISARTRARMELAGIYRLSHTMESSALDCERVSWSHERALLSSEIRRHIMARHVIIGAGAVGSAAATLLADRGDEVRLVTRRGTGPEHPAIERVAADATDAVRLSALTSGAVALYNCPSPLYHPWLTDWPPLASALLTAAERSGAVLASTSNLYGYGPGHERITPDTPLSATHPKLRLRAQMWRDALALHEAGRIRPTEVRGSDYLEANSIFSVVLGKPLLAGKRAYVPAPLDVPHSWTSTVDVARTLITVATDERGWGEAWLVPTNPPLTIRQLAQRFTRVHGA